MFNNCNRIANVSLKYGKYKVWRENQSMTTHNFSYFFFKHTYVWHDRNTKIKCGNKWQAQNIFISERTACSSYEILNHILEKNEHLLQGKTKSCQNYCSITASIFIILHCTWHCFCISVHLPQLIFIFWRVYLQKNIARDKDMHALHVLTSRMHFSFVMFLYI